jgi:FkbM family methyltransferase
VARLCRQYLTWYGNASYEPKKNGERWLIERLRGEHFETILDIGANVGAWAGLAATAFPAATTYALEIVPATFTLLRTAVARFPSIRPINLGLADHTGRLRVRYNPDASAHTTFTTYSHGWVGETLECEVTTGDAFLQAHNLTTVDFLKLDVEGAEHLVLRGFERALADGRIRFVQFEYGRVNILTGFLLKHFYDLFAEYGYVVGKIYPDYVDLQDYNLGDEDFLGPNFLACRRDEPLLARLRER